MQRGRQQHQLWTPSILVFTHPREIWWVFLLRSVFTWSGSNPQFITTKYLFVWTILSRELPFLMPRLWKLMTVLVTLQCNWNIRDLINSETCHLKPSAEVVSSWWFPAWDFLFMLCCPISFAPLLQLPYFTSTKYHHCGNSLWHKTELKSLVSPYFFPSSQPLLLSLCFSDWRTKHVLGECLAV